MLNLLTKRLTYITISLTISLSNFVQSNELQYRVVEETPKGTIIGNLFKSSFPSTGQNEKLNILNAKDKAVNCFKINDQGDLLIARRLDRDVICQKPTSEPIFMSKSDLSLVEDCKVTLQIASQNTNMVYRVTILIEDQNDNAPSWNINHIDLKFTDGCKERSKVALPPAHDNDIGPNAQIEYSIKETGLPLRINAVDGLYLETLQSLDREVKEFYKFTIVASDKGHPAKSTEIEVLLSIEDINDNNPIFSKATYRFKAIAENSPVGTMVGKLEATDADSGVNGKFHFKFAISVQAAVRNYFSVNADGTVVVHAPLDCDRGDSQFKFKVIVEDEALRPYSRLSESTVLITINDVNDEPPEIKLVFLSRDHRTNNPYIIENLPVGTLIGLLEVHDPDFKGNDAVTCQNPPQFSLIHEDRQSKYKVVTNVEFDREKITEVTLIIVCQDAAGNAASSNQSIMIQDVNDNSPIFSKSLYVTRIRENMPVNSRLSEKVLATDRDSDSFIQYSLTPDYSANFSIDKDSGYLSTKVLFDREECGSYMIKVLATDSSHGTINTGTGTVQVLIIDENDNKPTFNQEFYTFQISENNIPPTKVGVIEASDMDVTDQQRTLRFYFDQSSSRHFQIDHQSGLIRAMVSLDRENMTHYIFPVFVEDGRTSSPHRHIATSTVTVVIEDVNDNSPKFIIPNATRSSFEISMKETVGHKITYIMAEDNDYLENGRISYSITHGNEFGLFSVDQTSGLLFLSDSLQSTLHNSRRFFILTVTACDSGKPRSLCTDYKNLRIILKNGQDALSKGSDTQADSSTNTKQNNTHQEAIIICLAIVFITLLFSLAALLILMKCKPNLLCRRSSRATSKDKRFETCVNSQMMPTIDANIKEKDCDDAIRKFRSENLFWQPHGDHSKSKIGTLGPPFDHTNKPNYQTLESLCLASSTRSTAQPRFIDPCSCIQTLTPFSQSTSFLSHHDLNKAIQHPLNNNELMFNNGPHHIYQSVEDDNTVHFYSKLNDPRKESKYIINDQNLNCDSTHDNRILNDNEKGVNKYASYTCNEASFV